MAKIRSAAAGHKVDSCKKLTDLIFNDLTDRLSPRVRREFERHLRVCPDCVSFLNTYKNRLTHRNPERRRVAGESARHCARVFAAKSASNRRAVILFGNPSNGMTSLLAMLMQQTNNCPRRASKGRANLGIVFED